MSSSTPTPRRSRVRTVPALLALVLAVVAGPALWAPAAAAQPASATAVAGETRDGRCRVVVALPDAGRATEPGSATVTVEGGRQPARIVPLVSDRNTTVVVIDASDAVAPVLQPGLSGAASFVLSAPLTARTALVTDADPPAVVAPLRAGTADTLRGLATVRAAGERRTADALDLALHQLPPGADDPRLVLLYTAAPDASGPAAADLAARLTAAGAVLAVVVPGAAVPTYWSEVAAATGGAAVAAAGSGVVAAFDQLSADLQTRYLVTFAAPEALPASAVVRVDTPQGAVTANALVPSTVAAGPATRAPTDTGRTIGTIVGVVIAIGFVAVLVLLGVGIVQSGQRRPEDDPPEPASPAAPAGTWSVPGGTDSAADRDRLLAAMRTTVRGDRPAVLRPEGDGPGLGVSTAMAAFAQRWRRDYDVAWWVPAADPPLVADRMAELAERLDLASATDTAEEATQRLVEELRRRGRWLLVFDDAGSPRQLARFLPGGPGHVLIGSDDPEWEQHAVPVPVGPFRRDESVAVLRAHRPGLSAAEADQVAAVLRDVPQAVDLAGVTLAETGMSVSTYLRLAVGREDAGDGPAGTACAVALDRLAVDAPAALSLLQTLAWLGPDPVPLSLLEAQPDVLPPGLGPAADPTRLADLAAVAARRGLVRAEGDTVTLHPVPAALLVARAGADRRGATTAVRLLREGAPDDPAAPAARASWRALLPHVLVATDPARPLDGVFTDVGWLLQNAAAYLRVRGEPRAARALFEDAYDLYRDRLGPDHPDTVAAARTLADDLEALGEHEHARRVLHEAGIGPAGEPGDA
jgi:hypothetical protein